jgi:hypothetical protein
MMVSSSNQVVAQGALHARRVEQRTAAEKPHDVGHQWMMAIDREGQPGHFTLEGLRRVASLIRKASIKWKSKDFWMSLVR